jgi:hypothetical protein
LTYLAIIITLATIYYAAQTGTTGGEIRHTEIRTNTVTKATSAETNEKEE